MEARALVPSMLSLSTLEERCMSEVANDCFSGPADALFSFELFYRAASQDNQEAREAWQRCFSGILRGWLHRHPRKEEACRFDSEERYLNQAFEHFWQTIAESQQFECTALSTALKYLQASLYAVLLNTLRAHAGPRGISPSEADNSGELRREDDMNGRQLWECIQCLFPHVRERRVAFLLFHCNLRPCDILRYVPQEFRDVQEIYYLRRHILEQTLQCSDLMY